MPTSSLWQEIDALKNSIFLKTIRRRLVGDERQLEICSCRFKIDRSFASHGWLKGLRKNHNEKIHITRSLLPRNGRD